MARALLIDAANVIGSRPSGWWRDRSGAAGRFVDQVRAAVAAGRVEAPVIIVLEGAARLGAAESDSGGVRVVHAPGSGDDQLVSLAGDLALGQGAGWLPVLLVSADRQLGRRAAAVGAELAGPGWLYSRLDGPGE